MKRLAIALFLISLQTSWCETFTLCVLPDTQGSVQHKPEMFYSQVDWIVANQAKLNIPFVLHVGDMVDWDTPDHKPWMTFSDGFKRLDAAKIPYAVALGNHDTAAVKEGGSAAPGDVHANLRKSEVFNEFFPVTRFAVQQGRYEADKSDNAWYAFEAGGVKWLVISLEFCARQGPVDWAKTVTAAYPNHNVIILTHYHLNGNGSISQTNAGYGDLSPQQIYSDFIKQYSNVLLVLSGHVDRSARRVDEGIHGNRIYQVLQDYQTDNYGSGYIRLLEIDTSAKTIKASAYSPFLDKWDEGSAFVFEDVQFVGSTEIVEAALPR